MKNNEKQVEKEEKEIIDNDNNEDKEQKEVGNIQKEKSSKKLNSKVQFSHDVSNKQVDIDFYHNRGKDSNLDLRALEHMEKI